MTVAMGGEARVKAEQRAVASLANMTDPTRVRALLDNARRAGSATVERAAFDRLCALLPATAAGSVAHDVWKSVHALEELLRQERGKTTRLSRTRQKIERDGEARTAADLTMKREASSGFRDLIARGLPHLTFEAVVLRHHRHFEPAVQDAAAARLTEAGLDPQHFLHLSPKE
jgi:hypothetical protein